MSYLRKKYKIDSESESESDDNYEINNIIKEVITENKIAKNIEENDLTKLSKIIKKQSKPDKELLNEYNGLLVNIDDIFL